MDSCVPTAGQTAQSNRRRQSKPGLKIKWYFSWWTFAEGLLQGRMFYSHGKGEGKKGENYTPTRHCQKLWVCVTWLPGPGHFPCRMWAPLFVAAPRQSRSEACGLCRRRFPVQRHWGCKARYLCSLAPGSTACRGCLEIKCNYLQWAGSSMCSSCFTKQLN